MCGSFCVCLRNLRSGRKFLFYKKSCVCILIVVFGLIVILYQILPNETAPKEDRNLIGVFVPPIPGKDINTLEEKIKSVESIVKAMPESRHELIFMGDFGGYIILPLKPQALRDRSAQEIVDSISPFVMKIPSMDAYPWSLDSGLPGVRTTGGDGNLSLVISTTESYPKLFKAVEKVRKSLDQENLFQNIRHNLKLDTLLNFLISCSRSIINFRTTL